jgi:probable selenium-dependent hydroxylase accessory protein YqeC
MFLSIKPATCSLVELLGSYAMATYDSIEANNPICITVTGSGGKTSIMEALARHLADHDWRVLFSTTTRLLHPDNHEYGCDVYVLDGDAKKIPPIPTYGEIVFFGSFDGEKIACPGEALLQAVSKDFDVVLLEGDGARHLPLKIHAERDPVIPSFTNIVVAVMGLSALGQRLDASSMFLEDTYRLLTEDTDAFVSPTLYRRLVEHPQGVLKGVYGQLTVVVLNQSDVVDTEQLRKVKESMMALRVEDPITILAGSIKEDIVCWCISNGRDVFSEGATHAVI